MSSEEILNGSSLFTVSRQDIYDYRRCPKIVAIKTYRNIRRQRPVGRSDEPRVNVLIGKIGEIATELMLVREARMEPSNGHSNPQDLNGISDSLLWKLRGRLLRLDDAVQQRLVNVAKETVSGLARIRKSITEAYGDMAVLGHGEARYGLLPTIGHPDYVAVTGSGKPVLVEVKNTFRENRSHDRFQASFYNSLSRTVGVVVKQVGAGYTTGIDYSPNTVNGQDAETLLVYPRLGVWERVTDTVDVNSEILHGVWKAKELGILGQTPETECGPKCVHKKSRLDLPEGNIETAKPLPLIMAKGNVELGVDLDLKFYYSYLWRFAPDLVRTIWRLNAFDGNYRTMVMEQLEQLLRDRFHLGSEVSTMLLKNKSEAVFEARDSVTSESILKEMEADVEMWTRLLPSETVKRLSTVGQAFATRVYSLPEGSSMMVEKAWSAW